MGSGDLHVQVLKFPAWLQGLVGGRSWRGRQRPSYAGPCGCLRSLYLPEGIRKTLSSLIVSDLNFRKNLSAVVDLESEFR